jgi:Zn finger protein HypA/HybF involved in hydrogenase expression
MNFPEKSFQNICTLMIWNSLSQLMTEEKLKGYFYCPSCGSEQDGIYIRGEKGEVKSVAFEVKKDEVLDYIKKRQRE